MLELYKRYFGLSAGRIITGSRYLFDKQSL